MFSSARRVFRVLGPRPGILRRSTSGAGYLTRSSSSLATAPGIDVFADAGGDRSPYAFDRDQFLLVEAGNVPGISLDPVDRVLVGPHLERLRGPLVEGSQPGQLGQHPEYPGIRDHDRNIDGSTSPATGYDRPLGRLVMSK